MGYLAKSEYQSVSGLCLPVFVCGWLAQANVEIFEVWPQSCEWPDVCHGRHPAPWTRIVKQMVRELKRVGVRGERLAVVEGGGGSLERERESQDSLEREREKESVCTCVRVKAPR